MKKCRQKEAVIKCVELYGIPPKLQEKSVLSEE